MLRVAKIDETLFDRSWYPKQNQLTEIPYFWKNNNVCVCGFLIINAVAVLVSEVQRWANLYEQSGSYRKSSIMKLTWRDIYVRVQRRLYRYINCRESNVNWTLFPLGFRHITHMRDCAMCNTVWNIQFNWTSGCMGIFIFIVWPKNKVYPASLFRLYVERENCNHLPYIDTMFTLFGKF